jgi:4-hydroxybenzoate polyprenyltransferase
MTVEHVTVAVAGAVLVTLSAIGVLQIKRAFPKRGNWMITQVLLTWTGGTAVAALRGYGPVMWTVAPASVTLIAFVAGKGSVAVLINQTDDQTDNKTDDDRPLPEATVKARRRFGVIATVAVVVFIVGGTAFELFRG